MVLSLIKAGFTLNFLIQQHMHIAEYTMRLAQSSTALWTEMENKSISAFFTPGCWDKRALLRSAYDYQYTLISVSKHTSAVPVSGLEQPTSRLISSEQNHLAKTHTPFGSRTAQRNLPKKLNGVFVLARSSMHSAIPAPVNLLSGVICAPPRWLIHSHSRRRAALAAMLCWCRSAEEAQLVLFWPFPYKYPLTRGICGSRNVANQYRHRYFIEWVNSSPDLIWYSTGKLKINSYVLYGEKEWSNSLHWSS